MAKRCGCSVENGKLIINHAEIDWNLGFDREAKRAYVFNLETALRENYGFETIAEVTTASPIWKYKMLSPHCMKLKNEEGVVWDLMEELVNGAGDTIDVGLLYMNNISYEQSEMIKNIDCFTDVFHSTNLPIVQTQACWLAVYKIMLQQDLLYLLEDKRAFSEWFKTLDYKERLSKNEKD